MQVTYITPEGPRVAESLKQAILICEKEANEEARRTTGVVSTLSYPTSRTLIANRKTWKIPLRHA